MKLNNLKYIALCAIGLVACEPEFDNPIEESNDFTSGEADFSNYVALGNSITAGFASNALFITGQENSFPNILATNHFSATGGGDFTQPLVANNAGGLLLQGNPIQGRRLVLATDEDGNRAPMEYTGQEIQTEVSATLAGPFNNMGVPGAKSFHLVAPGYGNITGVVPGLSNPYFVRFASSPTTTILDDALAQNPTFFSLWIGNNDILSYATSGGTGVDQTGNIDFRTYGSADITDPSLFANIYGDVVNQLVGSGAKGVLITLPDVTSIPFFTTATIDALPLSQEQVTALEQSQLPALHNGVLGAALQSGMITEEEFQSRLLNYKVGANRILTKDESLTDLTEFMSQVLPTLGVDPQTTAVVSLIFGQARQTIEGDLVTLDAGSKLGIPVNPLTGVMMEGSTFITGVNFPADNAVLEIAEQAKISTALTSYNVTIQTIAEANGLALYDANAALKAVAETGVSFNGGMVTAEFGSGGAFTLDGVHPTPRVHSIVANGIAQAIESTYSANLPSVDPGDYGTITLSNEVN